MKKKKKIILIAVIGILLVVTIYVPISFYPLNKLLIGVIEKRIDADITLRSFKIHLRRSLAATGIEVFGKGGFALRADSVEIDYDLISLTTGRLHLSCNLENVEFYEGGSIINSLTDMLQIRPLGGITFKTAHADLYIGKNDTLTQNLRLVSDKLKIFGNAVTDKDNNIFCLLYFFLNKEIVKEMPEALRNSLLKKEDNQWSSMHLGIMGNYKKPRLSLITGQFRMNISPANAS
ncbi:MAG: hypothetical protein ISS34_06440 [Candidatus Omnitrophica bacterium]|nr:hypothetical protein [Candidatus Omnitrophota bacterium]